LPSNPSDQSTADAGVLLEDVSKTFHAAGRTVHALHGVSARIPAGVVTGLIGPDAAGKTTLMRVLAGLLLPDEGAINILGIDVVRNPLQVQETIGYMPQRFGLYEDLTVQENLDLYADLQGVPRPQRPERYAELMRMTGLAPFAKRLAGNLSGGMKQKLGLACALVRSPRLLLLDEPTVGVDPLSRRELWAIIYRLVEQEHMTVLLSTAYLDEAERCKEVLLMHEGVVLGQGSPTSFSERMKGRSFQVFAPDINKRALQEKLNLAAGVTDAIIHKGAVRVVVDEGITSLQPEKILPDVAGVNVRKIEPRFEDAFIAELKQRIASRTSLGLTGARVAHARGEEVIYVRGVSRRFGSFYAVKRISFSVKSGEVFGLLGANGAGKSTTFRMLCGLLPASEGTLRVAGEDLRRAAAKARARIGYMAQRFSLYVSLSVYENLRFFSNVYGLSGKARRSRIDWAMQEFELSDFAEVNSGDLPLGYKQRLALAAALMHQPAILFLDEPTSGVDPLARREFWHGINSLAEQGVTVLVTTHFMEEAEYCDRLVIMAAGEILAEGTPEQMRADFRSEKNPDPGMEDVFIGLIESREARRETA
jgi:ABC-2 type transport system ATP-binding protein